MKRLVIVGALVAAHLVIFGSIAFAQQLDCAPAYEGQKAQVGGSVQLQDGSWVTVENANVCMGEDVQSAAVHSVEQNAATGDSSIASSSSSAAPAAAAAAGASSGAAAPQGAANTGFGGMSDEASIALVLAIGALAAAATGAYIGRRRAA